MALHKSLTGNDLHVVHSYTYVDATARMSATGFAVSDIGKIALQSDTKSFWILTDITPTWMEITKTTPDHVFNRLKIGKSGAVDFTNISDAIAYAIANGASQFNFWNLEVHPGIYIENNPMTIPPGIILIGQGGLSGSVTIIPSNPNDDLFVMSGGVLNGLVFSGVSNPLKALVHTSSPGILNSIQSCVFTHAAVGLRINNGTIASPVNCYWVANNPGVAIDKGIIVEGTNSKLILVNSGFIALPSSLAHYPGSEPINTAIEINNSNTVSDIFNCVFFVSSNNISATSILVNGANSQIRLLGCSFEDGYIGVKIAASAAFSKVIVESSTIFDYTKNFIINSSTASIFEQATTDEIKTDIVPGATITGITGISSTESTILSGHVDYIYPSPSRKMANLPKFIFDKNSTGLTEGGIVSPFVGLEILVTAGEGWICREFEEDVYDVIWDMDTVTLTANSVNYVIFDGYRILSTTSFPSSDNILLSTVYTDEYGPKFIHNTFNNVRNSEFNLYRYLLATRKFALNSGLAVSQGSSVTKINVDTGSYYLSNTLINFIGDTDILFSYFYNNGNIEIPSQIDLNITQYDNGGILTMMNDGYYRVDTVYITSDNRVSLIFGTSQFDTNTAAGELGPGLAPIFIEPSGFAIANIIIKKNVGIDTIVDMRVQNNSNSIGGVGGVTDHGLLSGLLDDDHFQYLLVNGSRSMGGNLNLGGHNITNINLVDGVDVNNHAVRHNPGGLDALNVDVPINILVGATPSIGSANSYAISDHQHGIQSATPLTISSTNLQGTASTVSRSDHIHAHGNLAGGSTHALVISDPGGTAGYMSPSDKQKLDGIVSGATNTPLTNTAPITINKTSAIVGVTNEAARSDHKHDISTGIPVAIGITNSEGSATSLARSDHVHRGVTLQTVFTEINVNTTTTSTIFADLLTQSITTSGGNLIIHFTCSASNSNAGKLVNFRITVDGISKRGTQIRVSSANDAESASIITKITGLSIGNHIVKVQWLTDANTASIQPVLRPDVEHASLLITETTV